MAVVRLGGPSPCVCNGVQVRPEATRLQGRLFVQSLPPLQVVFPSAALERQQGWPPSQEARSGGSAGGRGARRLTRLAGGLLLMHYLASRRLFVRSEWNKVAVRQDAKGDSE
mmetsp:Transcript_60928/g.122150  ORF Transcript_60928/g.122150 Transcript_60928/m.122150 type:complete len:112 (+) Transcript_60928:630-965(+)